MKKATRRTKSKSSSKRVGAKSKVKKTTKARGSAKSKKRVTPRAGAKLKRVAKKAAIAAGLAAVGTALTELAPEKKGSERETSNETEPRKTSGG
jgi:hypothetical protein